jgi:hypothetical protein
MIVDLVGREGATGLHNRAKGEEFLAGLSQQIRIDPLQQRVEHGEHVAAGIRVQ